jgi:hypothetical protein
MLVLKTTSPQASPGPVNDRHLNTRPSSNASSAFMGCNPYPEAGAWGPGRMVCSKAVLISEIHAFYQ